MGWGGVNPPSDPSSYDPDNKFKDPVVYLKHREAVVAEEFVKMAEAKLIRKQLKECYKTSGVNWQQNCRELAQRYLEAIKGRGVYRANSGPHDAPRWEELGTGKK